jgi:malate permease and related proteins
MYQLLFHIITPVFVCAGLGYYWSKSGRPFNTETVTFLVTTIGAPLLIFSTLTRLEMDLNIFLEFAMIAFIALMMFFVIGFVTLKILKYDIHSYLPGLMFPNTGNMGLPLCLFAFGEEGLALAIAVFTVCAFLQFTLGVWLASGSGSVEQVFKTPLIYTVLAALALKFLDIDLPEPISNTTQLLGNMTIPLMLLALGVSLANLSVTHMKRAVFLSVMRLSMGFAIGLFLSELFDLTGTSRGVLIIECTMPVAVFNYLFSLRYDRAHSEVAGMVVVSTLLSFLTMPALLWFVLEP